MLLDLAGSVMIFCSISLGLAWPLAARLNLEPAEKLGARGMLSLVGVFLFSWTVYTFSLRAMFLQMLPGLTALGIFFNRRNVATTLRDVDARGLLAGQILVTSWCLALLALVLSYSGGGWVADWWGHLERSLFFLERGPRDILFNGLDPMPSRPPLANIVNGAFLEITQRDFRHYQLFSTLLGSLAFLPAALLARRWGGSQAIAFFAVLFMLNPLFAQNSTFAWTKLPTVFFVLTALFFFLRAHDPAAPRTAGILFSASLAAGLLTHYSTGPYALALAVGWPLLGWARRGDPTWWRTTTGAVAAGLIVLATWFGWALAEFGWHLTFLSNTSITDQAPTSGEQFRVILLNIRDTLVLHFLHPVDSTQIDQNSAFGWWRDWFFNFYQTNFFFAFGTVTWAGILAGLVRNWPNTPTLRRLFWAIFILGTAGLGIAVHGGRQTWGLAHICLQPLVILGLASLAAHWNTLGRNWRIALAAGAALDFLFGIALQFWVESDSLSRTFTASAAVGGIGLDYSLATQINLHAKQLNHWIFVGDIFAAHAGLVCGLLSLLLLLALVRAGRRPGPLSPQPSTHP